jgi:hypothetical protein
MTDSNNLTITPDPGNNGQSQPLNTTTSTYVPPGDVGSGFLVGTQLPAAVQRIGAATDSQVLTPEQIAALGASAVQPQLQQQGETLADMQTRMAAMQAELDAARTAREASEAEAAAAETARLEAERLANESTMSAAELVGQVRAEMQQQFTELQERAATSEALLERERHFQALEQYKASRLAEPEIAAVVMPHLHPYIVGTTEQEIEEAIARAAQTSNAIVSEFQSYQQQYRQQAPGVSTAAPTAGPMEQQASQQTLNAQQIAALSDAEYARLRPQLLRASGQSFRAQRGG